MTVAGGHQLIHSVRMMLEENPDFIAIKMDFQNAYTSVYRRAVVDALMDEPSL